MEAIALQSTGKIIVAGAVLPNSMALARFNRNGSLDTTFANGVVVTQPLTHFIHSMTLQSDDKIIVGGSVRDGALIRRFTKDGLLDTSFAGGATGFLAAEMGYLERLAVQRDNKILAAGWDFNFQRYVVYRLKAAGDLDTSFGVNGISKVRGGTGFAVAVQSHGCVVLTGLKNYAISPTWQPALLRFEGDPQAAMPWELPSTSRCYSDDPVNSPF